MNSLTHFIYLDSVFWQVRVCAGRAMLADTAQTLAAAPALLALEARPPLPVVPSAVQPAKSAQKGSTLEQVQKC